jgi:hypothetical protein
MSDRTADQVAADSPVLRAGAWHSIWLHGNWRYLTQKMTTLEREYAANCVAEHAVLLASLDGRPGRDEPTDLRWWRDET